MLLSVIFARGLSAEVQRHGAEPELLLRRCQVDPARLLDIRQRVNLDEAKLLVQTAIKLTGDPGLGLTMGVATPLEMLQLFGHLVLAQPTLRDAWGVLQRYSGLLADGFTAQLSECDDEATLTFEPDVELEESESFVVELALVLALRIGRHFLPTAAAPHAVQFRHAAPVYWPRYWDVFHCPVQFEQPCNAVTFPRAYLDSVQWHADSFVDAALRDAVELLLRERSSSLSVAQRLRTLLRYERDLGSVTLADMARRLGINTRFLRRSLAIEGVTLSGLVAEARCRLAYEELSRPDATLESTAKLLGFSDRSSFHRAFRRWTGRTPGQFVRRQGASGAPGQPLHTQVGAAPGE